MHICGVGGSELVKSGGKYLANFGYKWSVATTKRHSGPSSGRSQSSDQGREFSASLTGCSRFPCAGPWPGVLGFPAPGVLGFLSLTGGSRYPDRAFSVSCAGCSRLPWPGVLGFLRRAFSASCSCAGCSRYPVPGVLGYPISTGGFRCQANVLPRNAYLRAYNGAN